MASVVSVDMSPDLRLARIYVSVLGDEQHKKDTIEVLEGARGFMRCEIGERLDLRYVPDIQFILDQTIEQGQHIDRILRKIKEEADDDF